MIDTLPSGITESRRSFLSRLAKAGIVVSSLPALAPRLAGAEAAAAGQAVSFPGPWQFMLHRGSIILVSDQQLDDLQNPDKEIDLSLSSTPRLLTLRKICEQTRAAGGRTIVLAFDEFWSQYRPGQGGKPRQLLPDTDEYIQRLGRISEVVKAHGLGFELSLLSPLEIGRGYTRRTGESGQWVHYREGYRDPATSKYTVSLWEQRRWTNNKGTIELQRAGVRVYAFSEQRAGGTAFYAVNPAEIVELKAPVIEVDEASAGSTHARRMTVRGEGDTSAGKRDRVLVVVRYVTPEMDYFSPKALPFLEGLIESYKAAGVPLNGLYADEMHIQQNWGYHSQHDEGQFALRFLTPNFAARFAELYGTEYKDFEKYLVYFCYGQHGFLPSVDARLAAQHVFGQSIDDIHRAFLFRRRYYDLLENSVVELFTKAKRFAEKQYGHELEARAHATWAESPTCDARYPGTMAVAPRQYEYTPDFLWSNTVQQAASACSDYFAWNDFLTGGGNDHAEGGWSDRDYFGIALGCSTGILNSVPYAYAAGWGMPAEAGRRRQAICDAYGAAASPWFQSVQDSQHRDCEVLMIYPLSLVACEERFGSWMVQYGYANYVSPRKLVQMGSVTTDGKITMAGRKFGTVAVLFEPLPPPELMPLLEKFAAAGGKVIWSGPPPRFDLAGQPVFEAWKKLFGIESLGFHLEGQPGAGRQVQFSGSLASVPPQMVITDFLVDLLYPVTPAQGTEIVAKTAGKVLGVYRKLEKGGSTTFLGFRPRDDQSASLGEEVRTWFEILVALSAYPRVGTEGSVNDNPSVVSRSSPFVACDFPNGTTSVAVHYRTHVESWSGGFHRDAEKDKEALSKNPLDSDKLELKNFAVNGHRVNYDGTLVVAFRLDSRKVLVGFAGYICQQIEVDGQKVLFAKQPMHVLGWAPVAPERRLPGGALVELWVNGQSELHIPLPDKTGSGKLYFEGGKPGSLGAEIACKVVDGVLQFDAKQEWGQRHLFFVPV